MAMTAIARGVSDRRDERRPPREVWPRAPGGAAPGGADAVEKAWCAV